MENLDFISIGELAVDAFIRIKDAVVQCDENNENCKLCLDYGAKIPYESVEEVPAVANAGNASVCASRLGLRSAIVAHVGNDLNGGKCLNSLKKDGVEIQYVSAVPDKNTNYHYILWFKEDRTILQKHSEFEYDMPDIGNPKWIYLTSLGEKSLEFHTKLGDYLDKHPDIKLAFQPGIFQMQFGVEKLKSIYARSDIFVCNVAESQTILSETSRDLQILLKGIAKLGPKIVIITDGYDGAYAYDGKDSWFMPIYPHKPFERTGAGDAYASTTVSALALGKTLEEALLWAPINSMSVTQYVGAQKGLLSREKLEEYLKKAPVDYKLKKLN